MLLIPCPWCGPRDEAEFHYGGQAHVPYPENPAALTDQEWSRYLFFRDNPKGPFLSAGATPPAAADGSTRCATRRRTRSWRCTERTNHARTWVVGSRSARASAATWGCPHAELWG